MKADRQFAEYWNPGEFEADTQSSFVNFSRIAIRILYLPSLCKTFLSIETQCSSTFVSKNLEDSCECYFAELADQFKSILSLRPSGPFAVVKKQCRVALSLPSFIYLEGTNTKKTLLCSGTLPLFIEKSLKNLLM